MRTPDALEQATGCSGIRVPEQREVGLMNFHLVDVGVLTDGFFGLEIPGHVSAPVQQAVWGLEVSQGVARGGFSRGAVALLAGQGREAL